MRQIDADELVYGLTEMVRHSTGEYKHGIDAARLVAMEAPTIGGWISVKDRLPKHIDRIPVLYRFKNENMQVGLHISMLCYVRGPFCCDEPPHWERIGNIEYEVLYWFELPEPPKEET